MSEIQKPSLTVLSVFDGMSCGQIALKKMGITIDKYYAAEIDKYAIQQTAHNFPNTIHLGSVTDVKAKDLDKIDLFIGGSPCQGFSFAGKQLNFDDPRSALFFEYVRLWNEIKKINPNAYFLLENVNMKKEYLGVISEYLGVYPVRINSNLVSAQNRDRWYWTNIRTKDVGLFTELWSDVPQPKDKGILLKDVLQDESEVDEKYYLSDNAIKRLLNVGGNGFASNIKEPNDKAACVFASQHKLARGMDIVRGAVKFGRTEEAKAIRKENMKNGKDYTPFAKKQLNGIDEEKMNTITCHTAKDNLVCVAMRGRGENNEQQLEPRKDGKTNALTSVTKDNLVLGCDYRYDEGIRIKKDGKSNCLGARGGVSNDISGRPLVIIQEATNKGYIEVEPGECFDAENPKSKTRRGRKMDDKSNCLMAAQNSFLKFTEDFKLRRLTPTECSRLQTIPEDYEWIVSDTQQYKMLGNGWTVDVITHIFSFIPEIAEASKSGYVSE